MLSAHTVIWSLFYLILLLILEYPAPTAFAIRSNLTRLVYHNESVTWNQAHQACIQTGGYLVHIEDPNKQTVVLETFISLNAENVNHLWLGQVRPNIEESSYIQTDTCTAPSWSNWAWGQPSTDISDLCVRMGVTNGNWESVNCSENAHILCEHKTANPCIYKSIPDTTIEDNTGQVISKSEAVSAGTVQCEEKCDQSDHNVTGECWAVTVTDPINGECLLHYGKDDSTVQDATFRQTLMGAVLKLKFCIEGEIGSSLTMSTASSIWNHYDCAIGNFSLLPTEECDCPCDSLTPEQSRLFMADILASLTINISNLSSVRRRYYSVTQNDVVTLGIGYTGVIFIIIFVLVILLSDVDVLCRGRKSLFNP